jgi:hypothetical protein
MKLTRCTLTRQGLPKQYQEHNKKCHDLGDLIMRNKTKQNKQSTLLNTSPHKFMYELSII